MRSAGHRADQRRPEEMCLKETCLQAVRTHFAALNTAAILDLPTPLIKDLLCRLTVCQLDELQPALNQRGISTHSGWTAVLQDLCGPNHVMDFRSEEEAKHEVMRVLFTLVFYGFTNPFVNRNITNLHTPSFLRTAAKCVTKFLLIMSSHKPLQCLTAERRPLLHLLEQRIRSVGVTQCTDLSQRKTHPALYVLHRLLDHGTAQRLVVDVHCPTVLAWLLHRRGSQHVDPKLKKLMRCDKPPRTSQAASAASAGAACSPGPGSRPSQDQDDGVAPCKRSRPDSVSAEEECGRAAVTVDPQVICQTFAPCEAPSGRGCPWGRIECLEVRQCQSASLTVLNAALPTFFCLRSLTLHSFSTFRSSEVLALAAALSLLSESRCSSLTHLSVGGVPSTKLVDVLLSASPRVTSLHVEVQTVMWGPRSSPQHPTTAKSHMSELSLEKLTVKVAELQTDLRFLSSVLRRSPHLSCLHVAGLRLPSGRSHSALLRTLSESNHSLRSLHLEDMNLSDCLPEILHLLRGCKLEELRFNDCRLLEKWSDRQESLQQLVAALKAVPSLHTLSLAQNRLAKSVCVLAELFSGSAPSSVKQLDISSNFIQPGELLELAERLRTHRPPHRLSLDLRRNPGDRDPDTWNSALRSLRTSCALLVEGWASTDSMADYISNM